MYYNSRIAKIKAFADFTVFLLITDLGYFIVIRA